LVTPASSTPTHEWHSSWLAGLLVGHSPGKFGNIGLSGVGAGAIILF
jgi:hypothetical protein